MTNAPNFAQAESDRLSGLLFPIIAMGTDAARNGSAATGAALDLPR